MDAKPSSDDPLLDFGKMDHGCEHYRRRCKIRAPCCNQVYTCRHCHNEAVSALGDVKKHHELVRQDVKQVICLICDTEQPVSQVCTNCGVKMGEYFCDICKFYEDDTEKKQFHCQECGICRVGGRENFFHCRKCGSCYFTGLLDNHICVENSMQHHCSICYEYLFDSLKETTVLKCGHTMHTECFNEMKMRNQYTCPICFKSAVDMSRYWKKLEIEVQETLMPEDYRDKKVWILCNDCSHTSEVFYHIVGHQCRHCSSFNTRTTSAPAFPQ